MEAAVKGMCGSFLFDQGRRSFVLTEIGEYAEALKITGMDLKI